MAGNIFPFAIFFPLTEVSTTARSSLASRRTPVRFFCPRIHHHWARALASTMHPADDLHRR
jgi:hypothetical protein